MGCRVIGFSRTPKEGIEQVGLDELCRLSDVISVHLPLSEQTRGILTYDHFRRMRKNAVFINTGRGAQVVEDDLVRIL